MRNVKQGVGFVVAYHAFGGWIPFESAAAEAFADVRQKADGCGAVADLAVGGYRTVLVDAVDEVHLVRMAVLRRV